MIHWLSLAGVSDAFRFEWKRLMKFPRLAWWVGLAAFAPVILAIIVSFAGRPEDHELHDVAIFAYVLAGGCSSVLGLLLVATPVVYGELEGKTWTYLAVRPKGKGSVVAGKYLAAVSWSTTAAWLSLAIGALLVGSSSVARLWAVMFGMVVLSNLAIGAAMVFLGVLCLRRAMVFGVLYALIFEVVIGFVPAVIAKLTANWHLRAILFNGGDIPVTSEAVRQLVDDGSPIVHAGWLLVYAAAFLTAALWVLHRRQLVTQQED